MPLWPAANSLRQVEFERAKAEAAKGHGSRSGAGKKVSGTSINADREVGREGVFDLSLVMPFLCPYPCRCLRRLALVSFVVSSVVSISFSPFVGPPACVSC